MNLSRILLYFSFICHSCELSKKKKNEKQKKLEWFFFFTSVKISAVIE